MEPRVLGHSFNPTASEERLKSALASHRFFQLKRTGLPLHTHPETEPLSTSSISAWWCRSAFPYCFTQRMGALAYLPNESSRSVHSIILRSDRNVDRFCRRSGQDFFFIVLADRRSSRRGQFLNGVGDRCAHDQRRTETVLVEVEG